MSLALVVLGFASIVLTVAAGGGPLARGVVVGAVLALLGAGRLALARGSRASSGRG